MTVPAWCSWAPKPQQTSSGPIRWCVWFPAAQRPTNPKTLVRLRYPLPILHCNVPVLPGIRWGLSSSMKPLPQVIVNLDSWGIDLEDQRVNAWGGAIALGHPLGASGSRVLGTLARRLKAENRRWGL